MAKFSERQKITEARIEIQLDYIDEPLKNALWNILLEDFFSPISTSTEDSFSRKESPFSRISKHIWKEYFKGAVDQLIQTSYYDFTEINSGIFIRRIREWYYDTANWYEIYDLIEFIIQSINVDDSLVKKFNRVLELELSGYRIISRLVTPITSKDEINEINEGLNKVRSLNTVYEHLSLGLVHLSNRKAPDYRNSIKESISAVESICCIIVRDNKATLGAALKIIEERYSLHGALKGAFSALYGYTSDSGGIRHKLTSEDEVVGFNEAKFMFISCVAFTNYLIAKLNE
ncbi:MAG: hypothetical protein KA536_13580 [Saprospiraceae bacterium]|nr:hypothetical protein [Saprospiraceae bacterium]